MGRTRATLSGLILGGAIAAGLFLGSVPADLVVGQVHAEEAGIAGIVVDHFKYPEYNKDGKVEFILSGRRAVKVGVQTQIEDAILEWVEELPNATPGTAADRKLRVVGTVTTPAAIYDESTRIISGNREVKYRSEGLDVDGVGFDADQQRQILHVRSQVKVVLTQIAKVGAPSALPPNTPSAPVVDAQRPPVKGSPP